MYRRASKLWHIIFAWILKIFYRASIWYFLIANPPENQIVQFKIFYKILEWWNFYFDTKHKLLFLDIKENIVSGPGFLYLYDKKVPLQQTAFFTIKGVRRTQ